MALDLTEIDDANPINGGSHIERVKDGVECDDHKGRLRCTFDQVLSVFVKEFGDRGVVRPVPAVFGDKQNVDLFELLCVVRDKGGFDLVSKNRLWSVVAKELGLDSGSTASVKLIYCKYLSELEKWFREICRSRSLGNGQCGSFDLLPLELEREFRGLLLDGPEQNVNGDGVVKTEDNLPDTGDAYIMHLGTGKCDCNGDNNSCNDNHIDHSILPTTVNSTENNRKRKRESLSGMLNWLIQAATLGDHSVGVIPEPAKWQTYEGNEFWFQAIKAREALLVRRNINPKTEEFLRQKKLKMVPLMYEDNIAAGRPDRLRCSGRLPHSPKSRPCSCCNSSPHLVLHNKSKDEEPMKIDLPVPDALAIPSDDETRKKHVPVGPLYQADVPEWTGVPSESDSKWLGTRIWPLQCEEGNSLVETDNIGRGRPESCSCPLPGSAPCIRFHVAEARMKLKKEIGSLFYRWRFDRMGEEVSLQWTAVEEDRFKDLVRSNSPVFWNSASKYFPAKTRENLVSYYFNVFLVKRRSYQNRATPKNIDSDDDETNFGSFTEGFGHEAVKVPGSNFVPCSLNKQCQDFD